ncbi:TfuA-like protein [Microvirga pudoricolor]|uniref:TfuA-like protein n=1 Tax=Microvirga pudoricolor TaxID=2778729 RepID=UPI001950DD20|nr:TfuA-like protein [Microvirga pudoricolor]MBM6594040.1 tfuA protein [Microvirga pudoricolor]
MTPRTVVFLGPTLRRDEAEACLPAVYRPPAEGGDVVRAIQDGGARRIVLIDGIFAAVPAVRHKEILWALAQGVSVYGAASMGALRAAELHPFGMRGHGLIYRWYRATPLADDDEVAVAMMPPALGGQALGEALIDMRLTFRRAERHGVIDGRLRAALDAAARRLHFLDRTYAALLDDAACVLPDPLRGAVPALRAWIEIHAVRQKREDALGLLRHLASRPEETVVAPPFRMTEAWAADLDAAGLTVHHGG